MSYDGLIDKLIPYEEGELDDRGTVELFQQLVDTGLAWSLQGHYGRTARDLIEAGYIVPADFEVRPLNTALARSQAKRLLLCNTCGRSWDDAVVTSMTPAPSGRCPFEYFHAEEQS